MTDAPQDRISGTTHLLMKLTEPRNTPPAQRRGIYFSLAVTLDTLINLEDLLKSSNSFSSIRTGDVTVGAHRNPETYRSIENIRILADAGSASENFKAYFRIDGGRGRLHVKIDDDIYRSDSFSAADVRIAIGRHEEILRIRLRRNRKPVAKPAEPAQSLVERLSNAQAAEVAETAEA